MNTNRINNKNIKRFAIAAGATAAVLFLSAGLVASRGGESNNNSNADTPLAVVSAPIVEDVSPVVEQIVAETPLAEVSPTQSAPTSAKSVKSTKTRKTKTSSATTGGVVYLGPVPTETASAPETTAAPAPAVAEASVVAVPTEQPAVEQPAAAAAPAEQPTAAQSAPASQSGTTSISVPKLTMTDSINSSLKGIDLTNSPVKTTLPKLCIPGVTC